MKWTETYSVNVHDTDCKSVASLTGILRYLQDCANYAMEGRKPSYIELIESGKSFVLSRINLSIYAPIHPHDDIVVSTWACESSGASFDRCYQIKRDGKIVAEATSVWALIDINTKRLVRVSDFENNYDVDEMLELDMPKRFKLPDDFNPSLVGEYTVSYRDVDLNRHMNNTVYGDVLCGFIPEMTDSRVIKFEICYRAEAPLGENVKVYMQKADDTYYFRTVCQQKTNVEAAITIERL